ncbi:nucleoside diphosphate kinase [Parasitella parasitica]|nr:nucleoside diphosphate kinase [Parasitella parasitica]
MTVAIVKPDGMAHQRDILSHIQEHGFIIKHDSTLNASTDQIREWYFDKQDASYYPQLERYLTRSEIRVLQLWRVEAVPCLRQLIGPTDSKTARQLYPKSLRALYGTDIQENAIHASDSEESAEREFAIFFGGQAAVVNTRRFD